MAGAEDEGARLRHHRLDENVELAAADEAVVVSCVLSQAEVHIARTLRFEHLASGVPHFGFHAAAADGPEHGPILADQQLGAFVAGDGAVDMDDGGQGALLAEALEADDFFVDVHPLAL